MSEIHDVGKIQISENLPFLRKDWRFQRIGWIAMILFVLLGLSGALGRGPLSAVSGGDPAGLRISYERVIRHGADTELAITPAPALRRDTLRVFITAAYLRDFEIRNIIPEPVATGVRGPFVYYDFVGNQATQPYRITLHLVSDSYWETHASIFAAGAEPSEFRQVILP